MYLRPSWLCLSSPPSVRWLANLCPHPSPPLTRLRQHDSYAAPPRPVGSHSSSLPTLTADSTPHALPLLLPRATHKTSPSATTIYISFATGACLLLPPTITQWLDPPRSLLPTSWHVLHCSKPIVECAPLPPCHPIPHRCCQALWMTCHTEELSLCATTRPGRTISSCFFVFDVYKRWWDLCLYM
jgi:hypothetical protein